MDVPSQLEPDTTTKNNKNNNNNTSNNTTTTTVAASPTKKPWKLRQTCDLCGEAKVKCDKETPRCGRCDRLSYECVYSPARRIGRPRPRSPRSQDRGRPARDDAANTTTTATATTTLTSTDDAIKDYTAPPPLARPAELPPAARHQGFADCVHEQPLPDCFSDDAASSTARTQHASLSTSIRDGLLGSLEQPSLSLSLSSSSSSLSSGLHEVRHTAYEYDCATVAVATLRKLTAAGLEGRSASSPPSAAADVLADQIPHACREATRILVCPCSAEMDMALLAASLVAAILEVADAALRSLKPAGHPPDNGQRTVLALGTLPKISQLVTLFTHRYSATQASRPPEALLLLAASLRTTLKAMAKETTNGFLDSGAGPSRVEVAA